MENDLLIKIQIEEKNMPKKRRLELLFFWLSALAEMIMCIVHIWGEKRMSNRGEDE
jgi:hypothetical protein